MEGSGTSLRDPNLPPSLGTGPAAPPRRWEKVLEALAGMGVRKLLQRCELGLSQGWRGCSVSVSCCAAAGTPRLDVPSWDRAQVGP